MYREGWDSSRQELSFFMKRYVSFSQHRHIEQEVLVDDHVDLGKEKLCMCPRSSLRQNRPRIDATTWAPDTSHNMGPEYMSAWPLANLRAQCAASSFILW